MKRHITIPLFALVALLQFFGISMFGQTALMNANLTVNGTINYCGSDTGAANAYVCSNPAGAKVTKLTRGIFVIVTISSTNTGASTLAMDGTAATPIKKQQGTLDVVAGDLASSATLVLLYNGTSYDLISSVANAPASGGSVPAGTYIAGNTIPSPYLSDNALFAFHVALRAASTKVVNIPVIGDSVSSCINATFSSCWPEWLETQVTKYSGIPYHGSGIRVIGNNGGMSLNAGWTQAGTWTTGFDLGPTQPANGNAGSAFNTMWISSTAGSTISYATTYAGTGDTLRVYGETNTDNTGCNVSIDGGAATSIFTSTSASPTWAMASIGSTSGTHSVSITPTSTGKCYVYGIEWTSGTVGLSVHNLAHGFARSEAYAAAGGAVSVQTKVIGLLNLIPGGVPLTIIELGGNDATNGVGVTTTTFGNNLTTIITALRAFNPQMSILILDQNNNQAGYTSTPMTLAQHRAVEIALAYQYNCAYLSVADRWGDLSNATALGIMNGDQAHPTNQGQWDIEAMIEQRLIDAAH